MIKYLSVICLLSLPAYGHDIYKDWKQFNGASCCNDTDCQPVDERTKDSHYEALVDGRWITIPDSKVRKEPSPDGQAHICGIPLQDGAYIVYCYQPGMGS